MEVGMVGASQGYGRDLILRDVTFSLRPGISALLGPNGAGKTTLMRTLVTELPPRSGEVIIGDASVSSRRARYRARRHIGYLSQNFGYDSRFTVLEHVEYLAWLRGVPTRNLESNVRAAIELVSLTDKGSTRMGALSGGSRQRAGIAGAIVGNPELLVLDEPTVGLDPSQRATFRAIVAELPAERILLSTHLTDDVEQIGQNVIVLRDGRLSPSVTVDQFVSNYGSVEAAYLAQMGESVETKG